MKRYSNVVILIIISILFNVNIFANDNGHEKKKKDEHKATTEDCSHVHWGYKGEEAPEHWPDLCTSFSPCGGIVQSPIDISKAVHDKHLEPIIFDYYRTKTNIINNGHTIQFNVDKGSTISVDHKDYKLLQFHFHALSEHTIGGKHYPLEIHFVHKYADDDYAVIALLIKEGNENPLLKKYLDRFPKYKNTSFRSLGKFELIKLLPHNKSYFHYNGSLTTPPCSEVVNWYVLRTALTASKAQIKKLSQMLHHNYRPVQPLNRRVITFSSE